LNPFLLALFLFAAGLFAEDLPKGEAVLAKYVEATGGKAAYEQVHGSIARGSMALTAQNLKGTMTVYEQEPQQQVTVVEFPGIGRMEEGTDGKIAWSTSALEGARLKQGEEKAVALRSANMETKFLDWKKLFKSVENAGIEDVDGKPCYKLVLTPLVGRPETEYYDKATGLLVKQTATVAMPMGDIPVTMSIGDYRKEGQILMPHKLQQSVAGQKIEITIESVALNPEFPDKRFEPPADVKALIK